MYVAGSSDPLERPRVRRVMDTIAAMPGCALALDWLAAIEAAGSANAGLTLEQRRHYARANLKAIATADGFVFLAPVTVTRGAWLELGYALDCAAPVVCSGATKQSIFCSLVTEVESDEDAIEIVRKWESSR